MSMHTFDLLLIAMTIGVLAATAVGAVGLRRAGRRPRRHCPGPRTVGGRLRRAASRAWRRGCGYDLSGVLAAPAAGPIRCPECGCDGLAPADLLRSPQRSALLALGALLWALVAGAWLGGERAAMELRRALPASGLIALEAHLGSWTPDSLRLELRRRFDADTLSGLEALDMIPLLVHDLADDGQDWICRSAPDRLLRLGAFAHEGLRAALRSTSSRQRRRATDVLLCGDASPSSDLLVASFEALAIGGSPGRWSPSDARWDRAMRFATCHAYRWLDDLAVRIAEALESPDPGLRFGAAVVASHERGISDPAKAVPPLVAALADNDVAGDAALACQRLVRWGGAATPHLLEAVARGDRQQRVLAAAILVHPRMPQPVVGDALLGSALVDALRSDAITRREFGELCWYTRSGAAAWLLSHPTLCESALREGSRSSDDVQRATCRVILERSGWRLLTSRLMRVVATPPTPRAADPGPPRQRARRHRGRHGTRRSPGTAPMLRAARRDPRRPQRRRSRGRPVPAARGWP